MITVPLQGFNPMQYKKATQSSKGYEAVIANAVQVVETRSTRRRGQYLAEGIRRNRPTASRNL
jgi:hypothetical protein